MIIVLPLLGAAGAVYAKPRLVAGAKFGGGLSYMWGASRDSSYDSRPALSGGVFCSKSLNRFVSLQAELLLGRTGVRRHYVVLVPNGVVRFVETDRLTYLQIPLVIKFPFPVKSAWKPSIYVGGAAAIKLGGRATADYTPSGNDRIVTGNFSAPISNARSVDFGPIFGGDLTVPVTRSSRLLLDFRHWLGYNEPFKDVFIDESQVYGSAPVADLQTGKAPRLKNSTLTISLGVQWQLK